MHLTNYTTRLLRASLFALLITVLTSCEASNDKADIPARKPIVGTWKLLSGTLIEKSDTSVTDYTNNISFIKIINDSHFAFLQHDLNKGKDSAAVFAAGGGTYAFTDSSYTEHLEYCSDRNWEGNDFKFTVSFKDDTLIQRGIEKIEKEGIDRINIEKYVRVKTN